MTKRAPTPGRKPGWILPTTSASWWKSMKSGSSLKGAVMLKVAGLRTLYLCLSLAACSSKPAPIQDADSAAPEQAPAWRNLGPGGGGAVYGSTVNPHDPLNVFVRCDMTGSYVTLDGGESWRNFNLSTVVYGF